MRFLVVTSLAALATAGVFATSFTGVRAGGLDPSGPLFVTSVTPARNQETLPDLSDPGLNNEVTVRFSTYVRAGDLLDEGNAVNGLSRKVALVDQAFAPISGSATATRNFLRIDPFTYQRPTLPVGRYTLTLKPSIRSVGGRQLNDGRAAFKTSFHIGWGMFPVVLVRVTPRDAQTGVGLRRAVVATFDVPVDPVSALDSVRLEDRSTEPPTPIHALVTVERRGLDVVLHAESPGFAPGAEIALVVAGRGTATAEGAAVLRSADGIEFKRDWGPRWTADPDVPTLFHSELGDFDDVTGEFATTFRTRDAVTRR